jgi:crotonobetainyl-CoA:carnitine CoA-transferase CaiB-like acyl-CoA transferase
VSERDGHSTFAPLRGTTVIDLTSNIAGPLATTVLAYLGASVIKIERPLLGDDSRSWEPTVEAESLPFECYNRGKRSLALDLKVPAGRTVLDRLVTHADVFIHSLRPHSVDAIGFSPEQASARFPALIYCAVGAFGDGNIGKTLAGYDPIAQAFSGMMDMTGHEGSPPARSPVSLIDNATGLWAAIAIIASLSDRARTGGGNTIQSTLIDSAMALMPYQAVNSLLTNARPKRMGSAYALGAPHEAFQAQDGLVFIAAPGERLWQLFADTIGAHDLTTDPRFSTPPARVENMDALRRELAPYLADTPSAALVQMLNAAGVPAAPVLGLNEAVRHELAAERQWFDTVDGRLSMRLPLLIDGNSLRAASPAPALGEHSLEILEEAGFSNDEVRELVASGVVCERPSPAASEEAPTSNETIEQARRLLNDSE